LSESSFEVVEITDLANTGEGVGRDAQGRTAFIPMTTIGDRVEAKILRKRKRHWHGVVHSFLEKSPQRVEPACSLFGRCGGCDWQHIPYDAQSEAKARNLQQTIRRIARIEYEETPEIATGEAFYETRTRARFQISRQNRLGFFQRGSSEVIEIEECPVLTRNLNETLKGLTGLIQTWDVTFREIQMLGGIPKTPKEKANKALQLPVAVSLHLPRHARGDSYPKKQVWEAIWEQIQMCLPLVSGIEVWEHRRRAYTFGHPWISDGEPRVRYQPSGFAQASFANNRLLIQSVLSLLEDDFPKTVLEVYAGRGNLSLPLAQKGAKVVALESDTHAVAEGRRASKGLNGIDAGTLIFVPYHDERDDLKHKWKDKQNFPELLLLDPPRRGLSTRITDQIVKWLPPRILYVSCDAATLARDLRRLCDAGYQVEAIRAVDMMPQTSHVESLVLLAHSE